MDTPVNIMMLLYIMMMNVEQTTSSGPSAMQDQQAPHTVHEQGQSSNQHREDIVDDTSKQQISNIIPIGYKFQPTDPELIFHYLWKQVLQEPIDNKFFQSITATEFFAKHPKELVPNLNKEQMSNLNKERMPYYYFIRQDDDKVTQTRSNNGPTYWKLEIRGNTRIENPKNKQEIGYKNTYRCYKRCEDGKDRKTPWRMEEFSFDKKVHTEWILARLINGRDYS